MNDTDLSNTTKRVSLGKADMIIKHFVFSYIRLTSKYSFNTDDIALIIFLYCLPETNIIKDEHVEYKYNLYYTIIDKEIWQISYLAKYIKFRLNQKLPKPHNLGGYDLVWGFIKQCHVMDSSDVPFEIANIITLYYHEDIQYLSFEECDKLVIGDYIDHRDDVGRFLLASIVDKYIEQHTVKIHYKGWNTKWDTWCNYKQETYRFVKQRSVSRRTNTRFPNIKIRDYININPKVRHNGWRWGQIRRFEKYSGQVQVVYKEKGQDCLMWAHLNDPQEIAPWDINAKVFAANDYKLETNT